MLAPELTIYDFAWIVTMVLLVLAYQFGYWRCHEKHLRKEKRAERLEARRLHRLR